MRSFSQTSLFADEPTPSTSVIEVLARTKPAGKAHAAFHRVVGKIESARELLRKWQAYQARYNQRLASELMPLQQAFAQVRRQVAFRLDELARGSDGASPKIQRTKLRYLITDIAGGLLAEGADAELEALHDRYSEMPYSDVRTGEVAAAQALMEGALGVDLGEDVHDMEALLAKAAEELHEHSEEREEERRPHRKHREGRAGGDTARTRSEQDSHDASRSVRDVYRKLASALHPDREPDPALRTHKTAQMQRANQAYAAGDLLELLNLQLEIEQIDVRHLSDVPGERLAHYTRVLREQLTDVEASIEEVIAPFRMMLEMPFGPLSTERVDRSLTEAIASLGIGLEQAKADLARLTNRKALAQMLRAYRPIDDEELAMWWTDDTAVEPTPRRRSHRRRSR